MKTPGYLLLLLVATLVVSSGCGSTRKVYEDGVYFNLDDADREARTYNSKNRNQTKTDADLYSRQNQDEGSNLSSGNSDYSTNENGDIVIKNRYYDDSDFSYDDYYDYSYSSRLRRFHSNNNWNYYDPYYTNYYWYNYNPYYFGSSVYNTYSWWGPNYYYNYSNSYWGVSYHWGGGWGYPWSHHYWGGGYYNPWAYSGYNGWYFPYGGYGGYNGWGSPWCPYSMPTNGIWSNNLGTANLYYNSFDNNSYYYGPRTVGNTQQTVSFSKIMQDNGIQRDLTVRPVLHNPNFTQVNRQDNLQPLNITQASGGSVNRETNDGNTSTVNDRQTNSSGMVPNTADRYTGVDRNTSTVKTNNSVQRDNNTIVITNSGNTSGTESNRNNNSGNTQGNTNSVNRYSTNGSNYSPNTNSVRKWDNTDNDVIIIDRNSNSGQRSGTFSEGSRSNGYSNNDFYTPGRNNNNTYTPNNNQRGGGITPPQNNNNRNGNPPR